MPHILKIPTELLHLIFIEVSKQPPKPKSRDIGLKGLRLLCRAFNNAIVPILFSRITIDIGASPGSSAVQINQLARLGREHSVRCVYRVARTLRIRTLSPMNVHHTYGTRRGQHVDARLRMIDAGLTVAVTALTGLRDVRWTINRADPVARVAALVEGLCALPASLGFGVGIEYFANSVHSQLLWIGAHLTSFSVTALAQESFLVTHQPEDMELLAALVAGSPRLERLEFHRQTATRPVGLDAGTTPPADFNLDALLSALPPHRTCPPHLVLDGLRVQHMTAAHCLRGLQSLTLFIPRPRMNPRENDMWLAPLWSTLGAANVFPSCLAVDDLDSALIRYLAQHPGLEMFTLRWRKEFRGGHDTLAATFFDEVLPHHARTLRRLGLEFPEPFDPTLRDRAITRCVVLEAFSTHIVWIDRSDFAAALNKLLRVLSVIHGIRFLMLALSLAHGKLTSEVKQLVRRAVQAHVIKDEMLRVPAEIVVHGNRFCITHVDTVRKYVLSGQVASE